MSPRIPQFCIVRSVCLPHDLDSVLATCGDLHDQPDTRLCWWFQARGFGGATWWLLSPENLWQPMLVSQPGVKTPRRQADHPTIIRQGSHLLLVATDIPQRKISCTRWPEAPRSLECSWTNIQVLQTPKLKDISFAQPHRFTWKWGEGFLFVQIRHFLKWQQQN